VSKYDAENERDACASLWRGLHVTKLERNVLRFEPACRDRIDEIAELAGHVLQREVSRAAVVRAAVEAWLTTNDSIHPEQLVNAIRGAMAKRGRKRNKILYTTAVAQIRRAQIYERGGKCFAGLLSATMAKTLPLAR
jgi:hypothetical protein